MHVDLILSTALDGRYYSHFTDKEAKKFKIC